MSKSVATMATVLTFGIISAAQAQETARASAEPGVAASAHQHESMHAHMNGGSTDAIDPATFVAKAAQGGLTEVAVSKAAAASSQDAKIKQFADQMVRDHSKANDELASLAKSKGLQVPTSLDAEHQAIVQKLSNRKGPDFDAAYAKQMKEDHAKTVALFEAAMRSSDADLAAFAKKMLPTLKEHKHLAGDLPGAMHSAQTGAASRTQ